MFTERDIVKVDQTRLHRIYEEWPEHFHAASKIPAVPDYDIDHYDSLILCGMGASATSCDILNTVMQHFSKTPSVVLRGGKLPSFVNRRTLVVINSVSGNTQESVSMMEEASGRKADVICISSGGKLKEAAEKGGKKHINIPNLSVPRASLPYLILPGLRLINPFLENSMEYNLGSIHMQLSKIRKEISVTVPYRSNIAKKIASFFGDGFAFCFTSPSLISAATRFKNSLNENAKIHCLSESVLEASHNEIVPFTFIQRGFNPKVLLLRWKGDQTIINQRFEKVQSLFQKLNQPLEIMAFEKDLLIAIISSIYILDYSTIYMAISRKIDPSPTPAIDILKQT